MKRSLHPATSKHHPCLCQPNIEQLHQTAEINITKDLHEHDASVCSFIAKGKSGEKGIEFYVVILQTDKTYIWIVQVHVSFSEESMEQYSSSCNS